jgi:hypothetical protein
MKRTVATVLTLMALTVVLFLMPAPMNVNWGQEADAACGTTVAGRWINPESTANERLEIRNNGQWAMYENAELVRSGSWRAMGSDEVALDRAGTMLYLSQTKNSVSIPQYSEVLVRENQ